MSPFAAGGLIQLNSKQRYSFKRKSGKPRTCFKGKVPKFRLTMEEAAMFVFPAGVELYLCNECGYVHGGHPLRRYDYA